MQNENSVVFDIDRIPKEVCGVKLSESTLNDLAEGKESPLIEGMLYNGEEVKNAKVRVFKNGKTGELDFTFTFENQKLIIPAKIGDYTLNETDKIKLNAGETSGPMTIDGKKAYLQIDTETNSVTVKGEGEVDKRVVIKLKHEKGILDLGNYKPTNQEVKDLLDGKELKTKVFEQNGTYFSAKVTLTDDFTGITYKNLVQLSPQKAKELREKLNVNRDNLLEKVTAAGSNSLDGKNLKGEKTKDQSIESVIMSGSNAIREEGKDKNIFSSVQEFNKIPIQERSAILENIPSEVIFKDHEIKKIPEKENLYAVSFLNQSLVYTGTLSECKNEMNVSQKSFDLYLKEENSKESKFVDPIHEQSPVDVTKLEWRKEQAELRGISLDEFNKSIELKEAKRATIDKSYDRYMDYTRTTDLSKVDKEERSANFTEKLSAEGKEFKPLTKEAFAEKLGTDSQFRERFEYKERPIENVQRDQEFYKALNDKDFTKLAKMSNEGYKPSEEVVKNMDNLPGVKAEDKTAAKAIFGVSSEPEKKGLEAGKKNQPEGKSIANLSEEKGEKPGKKGDVAKQAIERLGNDM